MIKVFDDPLSNAFLVEDVLTRKHNTLFHILVAYCTGQIVKFVKLISFQFFEEGHGLR